MRALIIFGLLAVSSVQCFKVFSEFQDAAVEVESSGEASGRLRGTVAEDPASLPDQGLEGKDTRHLDMRTAVGNWRAEYGPDAHDSFNQDGKNSDVVNSGACVATTAAMTLAVGALLQWA
eukprot:gnl/TRDRNA2_/TRDRNA2_194664_c0_seq1.p1 gnl/TRDRNA2_/TRDRNA2_194664_c0~~gnl/TRDRNA2_/TRDRNA2_194664_c0_seq1.p1  ORF type:complete len:120 (-),score=17.33 gnl/TRDRNA2_/TRDRNA2_194664_c0_seq1:64-423(-)